MNRIEHLIDQVVIPSTPTRQFGQLIKEAEENGKTLYPADIGMPQEPYPQVAKKSLIAVVEATETAGYGPPIDKDLAKAIGLLYKKKFGLNPELVKNQLIAGLGASEIFALLLPVITQPNDLIFTFDPHYANFDIPMACHQVSWITSPTSAENNFQPDLSALEASLQDKQLSPKIKAIYINSPNNPTGAVLSEEQIKELIRIAQQYNRLIIWDGVYWNYNYTDKPSSILEVVSQMPEDEQKQALEKIVFLDSMSKTAYLCDWRLGWGFIGDPELFSRVINIGSYRGNISIELQKAAAALFYKYLEEDLAPLDKQRGIYQEKRDLVYQKLKQLADKKLIEITPQPPEGGFYISFNLPDELTSEEFLNWLLTEYNGQEITTFVPLTTSSGSFFNNHTDGRRTIRFCFGLPKEQLEKALNVFEQELKDFIDYKNSSE